MNDFVYKHQNNKMANYIIRIVILSISFLWGRRDEGLLMDNLMTFSVKLFLTKSK